MAKAEDAAAAERANEITEKKAKAAQSEKHLKQVKSRLLERKDRCEASLESNKTHVIPASEGPLYVHFSGLAGCVDAISAQSREGSTADWLDIVDVEGDVISLYVETNSTDKSRRATLSVVTPKETFRVNVIQKAKAGASDQMPKPASDAQPEKPKAGPEPTPGERLAAQAMNAEDPIAAFAQASSNVKSALSAPVARKAERTPKRSRLDSKAREGRSAAQSPDSTEL